MFCTVCGTLNDQPVSHCAECGTAIFISRRPHRDSPPPRNRRVVPFGLTIIPLLVISLIAVPVIGEQLTKRQEQAAAYGAAEQAFLHGDLERAAVWFASLGGDRDAEQWRQTVEEQLETYLTTVAEAERAYAGQEFHRAIQLLEPLVAESPGFALGQMHLERSRRALASNLLITANLAEANEDWLTAERSISEVVSLNPGADETGERLSKLIEEHGPLVYTRAGAVYISDPTGEHERALTGNVSATWPVWSPDRSRIAFYTPTSDSSRFDGTLTVMNGDGTDVVAVATRALPFTWASWSPDGRFLAYASIKHFDEETFSGRVSLQLFDFETMRERDLTGERVDHVTSPTWSPDGEQIAFISFQMERRRWGGADFLDGDTFVVDVATGELTNVTEGRVVDEGWVLWSPAGDRLLLFAAPGDWTNRRRSQILLLDLRTGDLSEIVIDSFELSMPAWSPDGTRFAYVTHRDTIHIWSDRGEEWLRVGHAVTPLLSWSPDGALLLAPAASDPYISYVLPMGERFGEVHEVKLKSSDFQGGNGPPVWAPKTSSSDRHAKTVSGTAMDADTRGAGTP
jgi:WD40 repeat protein